MFLFKDIPPLQSFLEFSRRNGRTIGFIPTMGALHQGHLSLIRACKDQGHLTVCSIFINPTQFNQESDFKAYPRHTPADMEMLLQAGCDVLFHPEAATMYPEGLQVKEYNFGPLTQTLEGLHRPGHFNGVITIVKRLFDIVQPDHAYFGQKDFQQCAVIAEMVRHFGLSVELHIQPIIRENNGLAMSSRNSRLNEEQKQQAADILQTLIWVKEQLFTLPLDQLRKEALFRLGKNLKPEYFEIADAQTLEPKTSIGINDTIVLLAAAWCGDVRLIDNLFMRE